MEAAKGSTEDKDIFRATSAFIFLGVPNRGLNIEQLKTMVKGQRNENLVSDLGIESQFLGLLHDTFCELFSLQNFRIISVYETKLSRTVEVRTVHQWVDISPVF